MAKRFLLLRCALLVVFLSVLAVFAVQTLAEENVLEHQYLSLTLPDGWVKKDIPSGSGKEVIGQLKSEKIAGASITVFCYRGRRYNYRKVRIIGLKSIAAAYPKGQEMLKKPTKLRTDSGYKAVVELWRGALDAGGQTVFLQTPMGIVRTRHCWLLMLGFTADSSGAQLEEDFMKIVKAVK